MLEWHLCASGTKTFSSFNTDRTSLRFFSKEGYGWLVLFVFPSVCFSNTLQIQKLSISDYGRSIDIRPTCRKDAFESPVKVIKMDIMYVSSYFICCVDTRRPGKLCCFHWWEQVLVLKQQVHSLLGIVIVISNFKYHQQEFPVHQNPFPVTFLDCVVNTIPQ